LTTSKHPGGCYARFTVPLLHPCQSRFTPMRRPGYLTTRYMKWHQTDCRYPHKTAQHARSLRLGFGCL